MALCVWHGRKNLTQCPRCLDSVVRTTGAVHVQLKEDMYEGWLPDMSALLLCAEPCTPMVVRHMMFKSFYYVSMGGDSSKHEGGFLRVILSVT